MAFLGRFENTSRILRRLPQIVGLLWLIILLVVAVRLTLQPHRNSVYPLFAATGHKWLAGLPLYLKVGRFRYSPAMAALFAAFATLPDRLGALAWLALNVGLFFAGWHRWVKTVPRTARTLLFPAAMLLWATPLLVGNFNNLQANPAALGLILLAAADLLHQRWNRVALYIALAATIKIYLLAFGLVWIVQHPRRLAWRLALACLLCAVVPFLLQHPAYVARCYADWISILQQDSRRMDPAFTVDTNMYKDLSILWFSWVGPVNIALYRVIQLAGALAVGAFAFSLRRSRFIPADRAIIALGAVILWILLLGPSTESATYLFAAPLVGWLVVEAWERPAQWMLKLLAAAAYWILVLAALSSWIPLGIHLKMFGLQPLAALFLTAALARWTWVQRRSIPSP